MEKLPRPITVRDTRMFAEGSGCESPGSPSEQLPSFFPTRLGDPNISVVKSAQAVVDTLTGTKEKLASQAEDHQQLFEELGAQISKCMDHAQEILRVVSAHDAPQQRKEPSSPSSPTRDPRRVSFRVQAERFRKPEISLADILSMEAPDSLVGDFGPQSCVRILHKTTRFYFRLLGKLLEEFLLPSDVCFAASPAFEVISLETYGPPDGEQEDSSMSKKDGVRRPSSSTSQPSAIAQSSEENTRRLRGEQVKEAVQQWVQWTSRSSGDLSSGRLGSAISGPVGEIVASANSNHELLRQMSFMVDTEEEESKISSSNALGLTKSIVGHFSKHLRHINQLVLQPTASGSPTSSMFTSPILCRCSPSPPLSSFPSSAATTSLRLSSEGLDKPLRRRKSSKDQSSSSSPSQQRPPTPPKTRPVFGRSQSLSALTHTTSSETTLAAKRCVLSPNEQLKFSPQPPPVPIVVHYPAPEGVAPLTSCLSPTKEGPLVGCSPRRPSNIRAGRFSPKVVSAVALNHPSPSEELTLAPSTDSSTASSLSYHLQLPTLSGVDILAPSSEKSSPISSHTPRSPRTPVRASPRRVSIAVIPEVFEISAFGGGPNFSGPTTSAASFELGGGASASVAVKPQPSPPPPFQTQTSFPRTDSFGAASSSSSGTMARMSPRRSILRNSSGSLLSPSPPSPSPASS